MTAKVLMVQGTASHVGKSLLVAALCRILRDGGVRVAPFKAQNMSLNSFVTPDGGEIGRAQAVQAEAAGLPPSVEMNPILLKPEADSRSQVVVLGRPQMTVSAAEYYKLKARLWPVVTGALDKLRAEYEVVVIEGAGSPAEVNFSATEIVNMSVARYCQSPVLLVGDIDRGGVFASLLGTLWLLPPEERALVKGLVVNKFRGDLRLLEPGLKFLAEKGGVPVAGVIPYLPDIGIAEEDSVGLKAQSGSTASSVDIAVIRLPHLSNFDDFDPLGAEEGVRLRYADSPDSLGHPDLVILPGSKTTAADLEWLRRSGLADAIAELHKQGAFVIGVCGGYQMLGEGIADPGCIESPEAFSRGLGLLPTRTVFTPGKETHQIKGEVAAGTGLLEGASGMPLQGYEIHMGRTGGERGAFRITERSGQPCSEYDGCLSADGRVLGTYIHGLFHNRELRRAMLTNIARSKGRKMDFNGEERPDVYQKLAEAVSRNLDMGLVYDIIGLGMKGCPGT